MSTSNEPVKLMSPEDCPKITTPFGELKRNYYYGVTIEQLNAFQRNAIEWAKQVVFNHKLCGMDQTAMGFFDAIEKGYTAELKKMESK